MDKGENNMSEEALEAAAAETKATLRADMNDMMLKVFDLSNKVNTIIDLIGYKFVYEELDPTTLSVIKIDKGPGWHTTGDVLVTEGDD